MMAPYELEERGLKILPLLFGPPKEPDSTCGYNYCIAETPDGIHRIEWKSWKDYPGYCIYDPHIDFVGVEDTLEEAILTANRLHAERICKLVCSL